MGHLRWLGSAAMLLGLLAPDAAAQSAGDARPADLEIPGGIAPLARALALDPDTATAARIVVEIAHLAYSVPDGQGDNARTLPVIRQYFDAIEAVTSAMRAITATPGTASRTPAILDALGLALTRDGGEVVPLANPSADMRRDVLERAGFDFTQIAEDLRRGRAPTLAVDAGRAPLPLGAGAWTRLLPEKLATRPLHRAILEDRHACLLYTGLAALDPETLDAIASIRDLGAALYERAPHFAALSGGLRIRNGAIVPPGGPDAAPLWESTVGEKLSDPGAFIRRLYQRDDGRIAYLFDAIASLDPVRQRYALGSWIRSPDDRRDRFRRLAVLFISSDESWRIRMTPFSRPAVDPALVLHVRAVSADGSPRSPESRAFWGAVLSDAAIDAVPAAGADPLSADAAWLVGRVLEAPIALRRQRLERLLFVERLLADGADASAALQAARGFARSPALMLTLERLQIRDTTLYGDAARRAAALGNVDGAHAAAALALYQGSLAIVERARFARTISVDTATALVRSLNALPVAGAGYEGAVARWFDESLLPTIGGSVTGANETALLRALAGISPAPPVPIAWEGVRYRVDVAGAEMARLARLRKDQHVNPIGAVLAFARAVAGTAPAQTAIPEIVVTTLNALILDRDPPALRGLHDAMRDARQSVRDGHLDGRDRERLIRLGDRLLAYSLMTLVYAANLGDADADPTTIFDAAIGDRHEFGRAGGLAWLIPREDSGPGQPWHLMGSLLALDIGLARFQLRRLSMEPPAQAPRISSNDRQTFAESVALMNPHDVQDSDLTAIAAAIARGREEVARLTPAATDATDARLRLGAWQREAIRWSIQHDPAAIPSLFSLSDLFWLGSPAPGVLERVDVWGACVRPIDGTLRLQMPRPEPWEVFSGRPSVGLLASRTPEVFLRVAEALATLKLPAALARGIVAAATLDLVDEATFGHHDDRLAVARYAETLTLARIQDYVSFLTAAGPLIPVPNR